MLSNYVNLAKKSKNFNFEKDLVSKYWLVASELGNKKFLRRKRTMRNVLWYIYMHVCIYHMVCWKTCLCKIVQFKFMRNINILIFLLINHIKMNIYATSSYQCDNDQFINACKIRMTRKLRGFYDLHFHFLSKLHKRCDPQFLVNENMV